MGILDRIKGKKEEHKDAVKEKKTVDVKAEKQSIKDSERSLKTKAKKLQKKEAKKTRRVITKDSSAYINLLSSLLTEKSTVLAQHNKYLFKVHSNSNKHQIKNAIEGYYGVSVMKVNIIKIHPKKRIQGRTVGYKQGYKKAVVTLKEGDTIGTAEGV